MEDEILSEINRMIDEKEGKTKYLLYRISNGRKILPYTAYEFAQSIMDSETLLTGEQAFNITKQLLFTALKGGYSKALADVLRICDKEYQDTVASKYAARVDGLPLTDFSGKSFHLDRTGNNLPVKAALIRKNGRNVLLITVKLDIIVTEKMDNYPDFKKAVFSGIRDWEGSYRVFSGQQLDVKIKIIETDSLIENRVAVVPLTSELFKLTSQSMKAVAVTDKMKKRSESILKHKRSFMTSFPVWNVAMPKMITLLSDECRFDDFNSIRTTVRHEFGHVLGLGDLYRDPLMKLDGVKKGSYRELDIYSLDEYYYYLVMCDNSAPVTNNDIEMVLLAFSENRAQLFQKSVWGKKISSALGRGN